MTENKIIVVGEVRGKAVNGVLESLYKYSRTTKATNPRTNLNKVVIGKVGNGMSYLKGVKMMNINTGKLGRGRKTSILEDFLRSSLDHDTKIIITDESSKYTPKTTEGSNVAPR